MGDYLANQKQRQEKSSLNTENIDRRLFELSALFEISQTLNSSLNLQSILNNILLMPMGRMMLAKGIVLLKEEGCDYKVEAIKGLPHSLYEKTINLTGIPAHPFFIKELSEEVPWIQFFNEFKIEFCIPFISRTDNLGLMGLSRKISGESFTDEEVEFLTSLSNIATTSIENALVFDKIQKVNRQLDHKIQELNTLFDIGKELNLTFEQDKILKLLSYALMGQVTVNNFIIALKEEDTFIAALVKGSSFALAEGNLCGELCARCAAILKPYLRKETSEFDNFLVDAGVRVVVPMQIQNEVKGYIFLSDKITNKDFTESDLEFLQTLGNVAIISIENARLFQETLEKQKLEEELAMARTIQNRLLPKKMPELANIEIHGINVPSKQVGGDYFDIIKIDDQRIGLAIADVSGKGMPASLLMSNLQASLHSLAGEDYTLDKLVGRINNVIYNNTDPEKYITFFYGLLNTQNLDLTFVNAGHNPPYVLHDDGNIDELIEGGIILGMMPDMPYVLGNCKLKKGDTMMLFTDGVTETMNDSDEEFEEKRLIEFIKSEGPQNSPERINELLINALKRFSNDNLQSDDITILTLKITG
jgi:sigma-B regulation protein RsbU (phosphoserine phosphatase)